MLAQHFLAKYARKLNRDIHRIDTDALAILLEYDWPGNVRELGSAIERAVTLADGVLLGAEAFRHLAWEMERPPKPAVPKARPGRDGGEADLPPLERVERDYILEVLQATRWNRKEASKILGISTVTLWRKIGGKGGDDSK